MIDRSRRWPLSHLAAGIVLLAALAFTTLPIAAQEASPAASPVAETDLDERIGSIPPEELLAALLETPVDEDLFPSAYPDVATEPWEDESDTDLEGVVGGVLIVSGDDLLGVYIIHPSEESATARYEEGLIEDAAFAGFDEVTGELNGPQRVTVDGLAAWQTATDDGEPPLISLRVENVILSATVSPDFETPSDELPPATPVTGEETLALAVAIVDHLDRVSADLAG